MEFGVISCFVAPYFVLADPSGRLMLPCYALFGLLGGLCIHVPWGWYFLYWLSGPDCMICLHCRRIVLSFCTELYGGSCAYLQNSLLPVSVPESCHLVVPSIRWNTG